MLPNFLIIGAPRAGTTWLAKNLREHPDVFMPRKKELHFFDREYEKGIDYYESYFAPATGQKAIGEASPGYIFREQVPELIHQHLPGAKLIACLRNPVDRLYSRYWNSKGKYAGNENLTFEEKIRSKPLFIEEGYYYDHLLRYYEHFPAEHILVTLFDDLESDPQQFLRTVYDFLDIDPDFDSPYTEQKINAASSKPRIGKSPLLWRLYRLLRRIDAISLAKKVEEMNRTDLPAMDGDTKAWLVNEVYFKKNEQLAGLIKRDLSHWNMI